MAFGLEVYSKLDAEIAKKQKEDSSPGWFFVRAWVLHLSLIISIAPPSTSTSTTAAANLLDHKLFFALLLLPLLLLNPSTPNANMFSSNLPSSSYFLSLDMVALCQKLI